MSARNTTSLVANKKSHASFARSRSALFGLLSTIISLAVAINIFAAHPASLQPRQQPQPLYTSDALKLRIAVKSVRNRFVGAAAPGPSAASLPPLVKYETEHCLPFSNMYSQLISHNLGQLTSSNFSTYTNSGHHLFIHDNCLLLDQTADRQAMQPVFSMLKQLLLKSSLPDLVLPVSFSSIEGASQNHTAGATFCSNLWQTDLLFPMLLPDDYASQSSPARHIMRITAHDVGHGEAEAPGGWHESRAAILQHEENDPHLLETGVRRWLEQASEELEHDKTRLKQPLDVEEHEARFEYTVWAPGDCSKFTFQVAPNALLFVIEGGEQWFTPLLKPFIHYIPIKINSTYSNLQEMMEWAAEHTYAASVISEQARELADLYLSPLGRECYALQTLSRLANTGFGNFALPASTDDVSACNDLQTCVAM